jgi:hypothetical protein
VKRFSILCVVLFATTCALAQKADVAFVLGGSFPSNTNVVILGPVAPLPATFRTDSHLFLQGTLGVRMVDAKAFSLLLEAPVVGVTSQNLNTLVGVFSFTNKLSTVFITPGLRLKLLPAELASPWVSFGGGWAHYSVDGGHKTNKGAVEYGFGLDFKTGLPLLGFRVELRDFVTGEPNFGLQTVVSGEGGLHHHNFMAGGGVVLRF